MTVQRWWPEAVFCEITPGSLSEGGAGDASTLHRLDQRLDDLQTLGIDAVLLRELEPDSKPAAEPGGTVQIDPRYGSLEDFDTLVRDSVRRGIRVLVELRPSSQGQALADDARFWLNHGVAGLAFVNGDLAGIRGLRSVLRSYVGERVLIAEGGAVSASLPFGTPSEPVQHAHRAGSASARASDQPDLVQITLPPAVAGAVPMRSALERARAMLVASGPRPLLSGPQASTDTSTARVFATALLGSGSAVLIRADDLDLSHAGAHETEGSIYSWYRQWNGLHRGNVTLRSGDEIALNHDAEGALVWVRQSRTGAAPIIAICNLTDKPLRLSLVDDIQKLGLRGSFLRTLSRSDKGMGAMPLRAVAIPPFGVYVGELSR